MFFLIRKNKKKFLRFLPVIFFILMIGLLSRWPVGLSFIQKSFSQLGSFTTTLFKGKLSVEECQNNLISLRSLAIDQVGLRALKEENTELKSLLNFSERVSYQQIVAKVLSRSISPSEINFIIDRGEDDGVKVGSAVVVSDGQIIGRVQETRSKLSIVRSLLSPNSRLPVTLLNTSHTIGLAEGTGGSLFSLSFIPQEDSVAVNDLVVTSGLEIDIPSGLVVGIVTGVSSDSAAPFQEAVIEPLVDARFFSTVGVLVLPADL